MFGLLLETCSQNLFIPIISILDSLRNLEPSKTFKLESFAEKVKGRELLTVFAKGSTFDICLGSECDSETGHKYFPRRFTIPPEADLRLLQHPRWCAL